MGFLNTSKYILSKLNSNRIQNKNYKFFQSQCSTLLKTNKGEFVVIHKQKQVKFFQSHAEAYDYACDHFELGTFLIQEITNKPVYVSGIS